MALTWEDFPKKHDRIALLGFAETSRAALPWQADDLEVFSLNEGYNFPWTKRWDRWFQIHPRWDFMRNTNNNDPNHFLWLTNQEGTCIQCAGTGKVVALTGKDKTRKECPACGGTGHYKPPTSRMTPAFPIYMQQSFDDIPNSVAFPLKEVVRALIPPYNKQQDYLTSSVSMMLGLTYIMGYKRIELYGFEMGATTEYHYQRANFEYLLGIIQARGVEVYLPPQSPILTGPLYAFRSMKQGYRQNLEMRLRTLQRQMDEEVSVVHELRGRQFALKELKKSDNIEGLIANLQSDIDQQMGLINGIKFAMQETANLTRMYDHYFWAGTEGGDVETVNTPTEEGSAQYVLQRYKIQMEARNAETKENADGAAGDAPEDSEA